MTAGNPVSHLRPQIHHSAKIFGQRFTISLIIAWKLCFATGKVIIFKKRKKKYKAIPFVSPINTVTAEKRGI